MESFEFLKLYIFGLFQKSNIFITLKHTFVLLNPRIIFHYQKKKKKKFNGLLWIYDFDILR